MTHPVTAVLAQERHEDWQLRLADRITAFAGSMVFIWIHVVMFGLWCSTGLLGVDPFPFNFLTMSVSLEAIFLATFVMIGQNRQADFTARKAAHDFAEQDQELKKNTALTTTAALNSELLHRVCDQLGIDHADIEQQLRDVA